MRNPSDPCSVYESPPKSGLVGVDLDVRGPFLMAAVVYTGNGGNRVSDEYEYEDDEVCWKCGGVVIPGKTGFMHCLSTEPDGDDPSSAIPSSVTYCHYAEYCEDSDDGYDDDSENCLVCAE